jgi:hypothetical protein
VNPAEAVRFYNRAGVPEHWATRAFHTPVALFAVSCLGARLRPFAALGAGMGLHVILDAAHEQRMNRARVAALERDQRTCQACGTRAPDVGTHLFRQPRLLASYQPQNVVSLCEPCHVLAHTPHSSVT